MLLSAVPVLVVAQSSSEIPEGLMITLYFKIFSASFIIIIIIIIMECHYLEARSLQKYTVLNGPTVFFVISLPKDLV